MSAHAGASVAEWLRRLAVKLLAPLRWGSNPKRGSCQLLTEGCWCIPRNNLFLKLWKLTATYNQIWLKNGVKHQFTSTFILSIQNTHHKRYANAKPSRIGIPFRLLGYR